MSGLPRRHQPTPSTRWTIYSVLVLNRYSPPFPPTCTGETLAHFEAVATLLALFSHFDISFAPGYLESTPMIKTEWCEHESPKYRPALTLPMVRSPPCHHARLRPCTACFRQADKVEIRCALP